jgi:hypothetical protein
LAASIAAIFLPISSAISASNTAATPLTNTFPVDAVSCFVSLSAVGVSKT